MIDLSVIRDAWKLAPILTTWTPETGAVHETLLLQTAEAKYALRIYRFQLADRWRIECEHTIIAYARNNQLPTIAPLTLDDGETIFEHEGRYYALFPFASGYQIQRTELSTEIIQTMGDFLAVLHIALQEYPSSVTPKRDYNFDISATLAKIEQIEQVIHARPQLESLDIQSLQRLAERRAWLATTSPVDMTAFLRLEQQVIHGDYQETNLFFEDGKVSAVIDWDQTYVAPRAWEVMRTLHLVLKLQPTLSSIFLAAYRQRLPLTLTELDSAAEAYGWMRAHDVWLYRALYLEGNQRVKVFVTPGNFVPLIEKWRTLRDSLS